MGESSANHLYELYPALLRMPVILRAEGRGEEYAILVPASCDAPIPGVSLTTCQPTETCEYQVLRYHTHMSHISRPISIYFSYKYPISYDILQEFDVQLFYTFTCQNILKLDCSNIFYKNASQGHNPAFFVLTTSKERRLL